MKLKVAIVDDERHCIETLKYDLEESFSEKVEVLFECNNSVECVENLRSIKPDVLFIDIEIVLFCYLCSYDAMHNIFLPHIFIVSLKCYKNANLNMIIYTFQ